jgi:hypothetical protein
MELELVRTYYPNGTNGYILYSNRLMMYSIELPWKDNLTQVSCIPEGRYELIKRFNHRFRWHLQVLNVRQRTGILIHPANDALQELEGCIAPVSFLTGVGKGQESRLALESLTSLVYGALDQHESVFITIKSDPYEST